jgi:DNA-binding NarL/FixJ family response regulator
MRIAFLDRSEVFRNGLWSALASHGIDAEKVLDTPGGGPEAVLGARPDVIFIQLAADADEGLKLIRRLKAADRRLLVAALCDDWTQTSASRAIAAGASACLPRTGSAADLLSRFDRMIAGELVMPEPAHAPLGPRSRSGRPGLGSLSSREREVFDLVVWGASNKDVAHRLGISVKTVETHRAHINRKLACRSAADMVRLAALWGVLEEPGDEAGARW